MIVQAHRPLAARRAAFTLMEVLVVVAIVVILASVGTIGVMKYLDDAKYTQAEQKMMNLETAEKTFRVNNNGFTINSIEDLLPYMDGNVAAITDPWGRTFVFSTEPLPNAYDPDQNRTFFFTQDERINPKTGMLLRWPR